MVEERIYEKCIPSMPNLKGIALYMNRKRNSNSKWTIAITIFSNGFFPLEEYDSFTWIFLNTHPAR